LKENLLWVRTFKTIEELRAELVAFARRYNETWLVALHRYKTPARVREEQTMPRIAIDPTFAATFPPGRLSKRSRVSQNRTALHSGAEGVLAWLTIFSSHNLNKLRPRASLDEKRRPTFDHVGRTEFTLS
jgi:hypothetical protein